MIVSFIKHYLTDYSSWLYFVLLIVEAVSIQYFCRYLSKKMYQKLCEYYFNFFGIEIEVTPDKLMTNFAPPIYFGYQVKIKFEKQLLFLKMMSFRDIQTDWSKKYPELEEFCYKNKIKFSYIDDLLFDIHLINGFGVFE